MDFKKRARELADLAIGQFPVLMALLYALVEFFPRFNGVDVMGSQWLYLSFLNIATSAYLLTRAYLVPSDLLNTKPFKFLSGFLLLAALSFFVAFNATESLVTYCRLITAAIAWINLCIIFINQPSSIYHTIRFISVVLIVQSVKELIGFLNSLPANHSLDLLIASMRGNAGNKNFLGGGILLRIPFLLVLIHDNKRLWYVLGLFGLYVSVGALLIINSRSTYLGFALISVVYGVYTLYRGWKYHNPKLIKGVLKYAFTALLAFASTQMLFTQISGADKGNYGSMDKRLASISFSNEGSSGRVRLWESAVDFISKNPVLGGGYGNWKINSIPYEASTVRGFGIRKHVHNDYLEVSADTGIAGGLCYTLFLVCIVWIGARLSVKRNTPEHLQLYAGVLTLSVIGFMSDSLFNFPMERPNMFLHMFFSAACITALNIRSSGYATKKTPWQNGFYFLCIGCAVATSWVAIQVYRSMTVQRIVQREWFGSTKPANPPFRSSAINHRFPAIPNINELGMPIACMKAKYLVQDRKFAAARAELDAGNHANPHLYYAEFLRTQMALAEGDTASALRWAQVVHTNRPANQQAFEKRYNIGLALHDTTDMRRAYELKIRIRPEASDFILHAGSMLKLTGDSAEQAAILRDGVKQFPKLLQVQEKGKY